MSRNDAFDNIEYRYAGVKETGGKTRIHVVEAVHPDRGQLGRLEWTAKQVHNIDVNHEVRRQGVGTKLWETAQSLADGRKIPAPKHSSQRTTAGDAWARSVGGPLPRRDRR